MKFIAYQKDPLNVCAFCLAATCYTKLTTKTGNALVKFKEVYL
jgi:hypothetical protein